MRYTFYLSSLFVLLTMVIGGHFAFAQNEEQSSQEVQVLNAEILDKKASINQINEKIASYQKEIEKKQAEKISLSVELDLLDNRIAKTELEIQETEATMDLINAEITLLQQQTRELQAKVDKNKELLKGVLVEIHVQDQSLPLDVFFGSDSLSELFDEVHALETVNQDLKLSLDKIQAAQEQVNEKQVAQETKRAQMEETQQTLTKIKQQLEEEIDAQEVLISQTQRSEAAFQSLVQKLKQEQTSISQEISTLQQEVEEKLRTHETIPDDTSVMSWPINPNVRGISATFHDPTYPFRNLFEHPGIDLPASTGTPIKAAASGYVAWVRKGTQYGNYVMIIHSNGLATLYAHMSRIDVQVDQYISRGGTVGAVGSTGLSTGPHLHFEVRKNGIPTNPLAYLPSF